MIWKKNLGNGLGTFQLTNYELSQYKEIIFGTVLLVGKHTRSEVWLMQVK
jgi:hypothetical protein